MIAFEYVKLLILLVRKESRGAAVMDDHNSSADLASAGSLYI
jgi:hypothetical protein